jgi:hypothetical protein
MGFVLFYFEKNLGESEEGGGEGGLFCLVRVTWELAADSCCCHITVVGFRVIKSKG